MDIAHPEYLLLLLMLPVIGIFYAILLKWKRNTFLKIGNPDVVKLLVQDFSLKKFRFKFYLFCLAFAFCILALAGWQSPDKSRKITRKGSDIMIALDVSRSMLAQDLKPDRLERAKQLILTLAQKSDGDRFGLVLFAGRAYLQMPLTWDINALSMYLASASPDNISTQGTNIGDALTMCRAAFTSDEKTFKSILLITDGEDHDQSAIDESKSIADAGIMINTVGIGTSEGAPIADEELGGYKKDAEGKVVISKLNEKELQTIALNGKGIYQLYTKPEVLADNILKQLTPKSFERTVLTNDYDSFIPYFQYFIAVALIFLLGEYFLSEKKKSKTGKIKFTLFLLILIIPFYGTAQTSPSLIEKGNQFYRNQDYHKAIDTYLKTIQSNGNPSIANFNLGNAYFKNENKDKALQYYNEVINRSTDQGLKQSAFYNKGVVLQKNNQLTEAADAYKNALLLNPNDEEARQNLQRILKQLNHPQKPNNSKNNQDKKNNENEKQNPPEPKNPPNQNKSNLTKQDAEEKLKTLAQEEKKIREKFNRSRGSVPNRPEKDW